jgi:hypothetical protein
VDAGFTEPANEREKARCLKGTRFLFVMEGSWEESWEESCSTVRNGLIKKYLKKGCRIRNKTHIKGVVQGWVKEVEPWFGEGL